MLGKGNYRVDVAARNGRTVAFGAGPDTDDRDGAASETNDADHTTQGDAKQVEESAASVGGGLRCIRSACHKSMVNK